MFSKREVIIFFAGAEAFHTLSHIFLTLLCAPCQCYLIMPIVITPLLNFWAIVLNATITVALLWWASKTKK